MSGDCDMCHSRGSKSRLESESRYTPCDYDRDSPRWHSHVSLSSILYRRWGSVCDSAQATMPLAMSPGTVASGTSATWGNAYVVSSSMSVLVVSLVEVDTKEGRSLGEFLCNRGTLDSGMRPEIREPGKGITRE
ncbi:hypothetical protein L6452_03532 [Arctium lappa]|uniref:Uncharacterized protein n=1 Tax=Arctium lappa TaxID=4217 RepID=A0ACB9FN25_ARCLA|nr:hypothetical protein L6452_03532 [Arctium lappa]